MDGSNASTSAAAIPAFTAPATAPAAPLKRNEFLGKITKILLPVMEYYYHIGEELGLSSHTLIEIDTLGNNVFLKMKEVLRAWLNGQNQTAGDVTPEIIIKALESCSYITEQIRNESLKPQDLANVKEDLTNNSHLFNVVRPAGVAKKRSAQFHGKDVSPPARAGSKRKVGASGSSSGPTPKRRSVHKPRSTPTNDPTYGMGLSLKTKPQLIDLVKQLVTEKQKLCEQVEQLKTGGDTTQPPLPSGT